MSETPKWPTYPTGSHDSIFALGVASSKFAELESILQFVFSTIFQLSLEHGPMVVAKLGNEAALDLARRAMLTAEILQTPSLPPTVTADVEYFLKGFDLCLKNRNHLMHSNFVWNEQPIFSRPPNKAKPKWHSQPSRSYVK